MPESNAERDHAEEVEIIKRWMQEQPHLPNQFCDLMILRFLYSCNFSIEKVKSIMELFFSIRSSTPEVFTQRDPLAAEIRQVFAITDMIPLPNKTKENYKVFLYRLNNPNLDLFNFVDSVKAFFMLGDLRLSEEPDIPAGEVPIFDSTNISLRFLTKINLSVLKKYMVYTQEALPIRLKQVHIINSPAYIDRLFSIIKPLLKSEVAKQIHFHQPNSDTLYKFVPRELLPDEYGGRAGRLCDLKNHWIRRIEDKREFFRNDEWAVNNGSHPTDTHKTKQESASFRSLAID